MLTKVTKREVLEFAGRAVAGLFANPASGNLLIDSYGRQQIISQIVQDTTNAFVSMGIDIDEE